MTYLPYTGVGSRQTPPVIQQAFQQIAYLLSQHGWTLRSGGAEGADQAFEAGAVRGFDAPPGTGSREIFLPWKGFNRSASYLHTPTPEAFRIAEKTHPAWHRCSQSAQKMHARNVHQVLGADLQSPTMFVVCWTEGGGLVGGTATAIRLAQRFEIPVFNFGNEERYQAFRLKFYQICTREISPRDV